MPANIATVSNLGAENPADVIFDVGADFPTSFSEWTGPDNVVYVKIPTFYRKVNTVTDDQITSFSISTEKIDADYKPYSCFVYNGVTLPYICIAKYASAGNPIATARTSAQAKGKGFQLFDWQMLRLLQDLFVVADYKVNGNKINFGGNGTVRADFIGIYSLNIETFIDGIATTSIAGDHHWLLSYDPSKYVNNPSTDSEGYLTAYSVASGSIKKLGYDADNPFFNFSSEAATPTNYTKYYTDNNYRNAQAVATSVIGARGEQFGIFALFIDIGWDRTSGIQGRYAYRPLHYAEGVDVANLSGIFVGSTEIQKVILNGATIYSKAPAGTSISYSILDGADMYDVDSVNFCFDDSDPEDTALGSIAIDNNWPATGTFIPASGDVSTFKDGFYIYITRTSYDVADGSCTGTLNGAQITFTAVGSDTWFSDMLQLVDGSNTLVITLELDD